MENTNTSSVPEKLDRLAIWVGLSVASAFFSSLERFACVHLHTYDTDDDEDDEDPNANDPPPTTITNNNVPSDPPAPSDH